MRCQNDVETFAKIFFPHYCRYSFNQFHRDLFQYWRSNPRSSRRAFAAPRGYAKSTFVSLIRPIHDLCYKRENYICIFSNTEAQAIGRLENLRRELLENAFLTTIFGKFFASSKVAKGSYVAEYDGHKCLFEAFGAGTEVRGVSFGAARPSKIICDDVEHSEHVHSEELRSKHKDWYQEVISKLGDKETNIEFIGTVLHKESLLAGILKNPVYKGNLYKGVISFSSREDLWQKWKELYINLDDVNRKEHAEAFYKLHEKQMLEGTEVLWPERMSYYELMIEMIEIGRKAFLKEEQNEPFDSENSLFDTFHWYTEQPGGLLVEKSGALIPWSELRPYGAMDPATGQTKAKAGKLGDFTCIVTGYLDSRNRLFVHHDWTKRCGPSAFIGSIFDQAETFNYLKFAVETNLYQNLLMPNIQAERKKRESERRARGLEDWAINIRFHEVHTTENKHKRIHTLEPRVHNGQIVFNKALSEEFKRQMEAFPLGAHDDCPDALEHLSSMVHKRFEAGGIKLNAMAR